MFHMSFNFDAIAQVARAISNTFEDLLRSGFDSAVDPLGYPIDESTFPDSSLPRPRSDMVRSIQISGSYTLMADFFARLSVELYNMKLPHGLNASRAYARPDIWTYEYEDLAIPDEVLLQSAGLYSKKNPAFFNIMLDTLSKEGYLDLLFSNMESLFLKLHHSHKSQHRFSFDELLHFGASPFVAKYVMETGIPETRFDWTDFSLDDFRHLIYAILIVYAAGVWKELRYMGSSISLSRVVRFYLADSQRDLFARRFFGEVFSYFPAFSRYQ